jgi:hypothetical protein
MNAFIFWIKQLSSNISTKSEPISINPINPNSRFIGSNPIVFAGQTPGEPEFNSTHGARIRRILNKINEATRIKAGDTPNIKFSSRQRVSLTPASGDKPKSSAQIFISKLLAKLKFRARSNSGRKIKYVYPKRSVIKK